MMQLHGNSSLNRFDDHFSTLANIVMRGFFDDEDTFGPLSSDFDRGFFGFDPFRNCVTPMMTADPFFHNEKISKHAFDEAQKLLDRSSHVDKLNAMSIEKPTSLLEEGIDESLGQLYTGCADKKHAKVMGASYQMSSITKDGKTATVSKISQLSPNGKVRTKVNERVEDAEGHCKSKTWKKFKNLKSDSNHSHKRLTHNTTESVNTASPKKELTHDK